MFRFCKILAKGGPTVNFGSNSDHSLNGPECRGGEKQLQTEQEKKYVEKVGNHWFTA